VGSAPPAECALRIAELLGGRGSDALHERAPLFCNLGIVGRVAAGQAPEESLEHRDVLFPATELREQIRRRGERLFLLGIELEHALECLQRARRVVQAITADEADLETARNFAHGIRRQIHLALGDADGGVEVAARLVEPAQRGVGFEVIRVDVREQRLERLDRVARRTELLLENFCALGRELCRASEIVGQPRRDHDADLAT